MVISHFKIFKREVVAPTSSTFWMRGVPCGFVIPADALIFMFGGLLSGGFVIFLHIFGIFWDHGMFNITWLYLVGGLEPWNLIFIYIYYFSISWEFLPTDFHSIIFQRGRSTTNQLRWFFASRWSYRTWPLSTAAACPGGARGKHCSVFFEVKKWGLSEICSPQKWLAFHVFHCFSIKTGHENCQRTGTYIDGILQVEKLQRWQQSSRVQAEVLVLLERHSEAIEACSAVLALNSRRPGTLGWPWWDQGWVERVPGLLSLSTKTPNKKETKQGERAKVANRLIMINLYLSHLEDATNWHAVAIVYSIWKHLAVNLVLIGRPWSESDVAFRS